MSLRIAVIGAGFGGCGAALALARNGHAVTVLEAVRDPKPIGAGIMLQPSGMLALARWGVLEEVLAHGERCERLRCVQNDGQLLFHLQYAVHDSRLFGLGLHRGALFSALFGKLEPSGVRVLLGVQATKIEGAYVLDSESHRHGPFDLIVIADGARSKMRAALGHALRDDEYPWGALWFVGNDPSRIYRDELLQYMHGTGLMLGLLPTGTFPGEPTPRVSLFFSIRLSELGNWRAQGLDAAARSTQHARPARKRYSSLFLSYGASRCTLRKMRRNATNECNAAPQTRTSRTPATRRLRI